MNNSEIRLILNKDIDRIKWDRCIDNSSYGIAYAYSWYLDRICSHWDALIWEDYQYVMPLVNNKKYGISYIYQPFFTQQLGVFSSLIPEPKIINEFLDAIPKQFKLIDMNLNIGNKFQPIDFSFRHNSTYHLNLRSELSDIHAIYKSNTKRNIQKATQQNIKIKQINDINQFLRFTAENLKSKSPEIKGRHYSSLQKVIGYALENQCGEILGAVNSANQLLASVFFPKTNQTAIYLAASSNQVGIEKSAMFLLIDTFIQQNAGQNLTLDFEGSNIPGVARFYAGFGAIPETYLSVHQNHLPGFLQVFKR